MSNPKTEVWCSAPENNLQLAAIRLQCSTTDIIVRDVAAAVSACSSSH